jgi:ribosomal protein S18 acetylase RimI-like enzyme
MPELSLRPSGPDDEQFLAAVYASTRAEELAPVPWTAEQKKLFLDQQFHAQDVAYRESYLDASFSVVELDGVPIGRLILTRLEGNELRIVDIALVPEHQNAGFGTRLIRDVLATAEHDDLMVSLHVEVWNPAVRLYERLGFRRVSANEVHLRMEWTRTEPIS